jgi:Protein kinase domain
VASIVSCPTCAAIVVPKESGGVCPQCRTPLPGVVVETIAGDDDAGLSDVASAKSEGGDVTRLADGNDSERSKPRSSSRSSVSSSSGWLSSSGAIDHGRFEPGALLGGRYRIIERLGRGGMGEVYRADDLKLGQPVALKFLPADVDRDPARLTQLHTEVRMARQVSHPNVCRVYDIDEIDGHTFLSMEYVDGEDLASLLRRVGRFPEDRALEIARQICAGLAAAHERDVVHRDLKPANVMLDGTGKVRLTDFGLAGAAGEAIRAGTPAYMAPEQLAGHEVTPRSDIYSLGLVLYEIFTGQRALDGKNLAELIHKREQAGINPPASIVKTLDPKIESAIMRCLKPEPEARPASALAVAALLPGGDPLAAALAAGETPSPQMVAAAGTREALSLGLTLAAAAWIVTSLAIIALCYQRSLMINRLSLPKPPEALVDRAHEARTALGYSDRPVDEAAGFGVSSDFVRFVERSMTGPRRWDVLRTPRPETVFFWYRTSPRTLIPLGDENSVTRANPPLTLAGMTVVAVDATGRLSEFLAIPSPDEPHAAPPPTDWRKLFDLAGLPFDKFSEVAPAVVPPVYSSERKAWEGQLPELPEHKVRIEAASLAGKAVYFAIAAPWSVSGRAVAAPPGLYSQIMNGVASLVMPSLMAIGVYLARRNIKAGRGDREGALRLAVFVFVSGMIAWALSNTHVPALQTEIQRVFGAIGASLFNAALMWLAYLGLEPYVRRHSPDSLLGWSRLLSGNWRNPRVGVDLIVGVSAALAMTVLFAIHNHLPTLAGYSEPTPILRDVRIFSGLTLLFGAIVSQISDAVLSSMLAVVGIVGFIMLLRSRRLATVVAMVVFAPAVMQGMFPGDTPRLDLAIAFCIGAIFVLVIVRAGLLAAAATLATHFILLSAPITTDVSSWRGPFGLWPVAVVLVLGLGGCYLAYKDRDDHIFGDTQS